MPYSIATKKIEKRKTNSEYVVSMLAIWKKSL
jgi:hypothetical protein